MDSADVSTVTVAPIAASVHLPNALIIPNAVAAEVVNLVVLGV